jgi:hypothetical protein
MNIVELGLSKRDYKIADLTQTHFEEYNQTTKKLIRKFRKQQEDGTVMFFLSGKDTVFVDIVASEKAKKSGDNKETIPLRWKNYIIFPKDISEIHLKTDNYGEFESLTLKTNAGDCVIDSEGISV